MRDRVLFFDVSPFAYAIAYGLVNPNLIYIRYRVFSGLAFVYTR